MSMFVTPAPYDPEVPVQTHNELRIMLEDGQVFDLSVQNLNGMLVLTVRTPNPSGMTLRLSGAVNTLHLHDESLELQRQRVQREIARARLVLGKWE